MDIIDKNIKTISFEDVKNFCALGYSEGSELDYKKELSNHFWKDLQKYVSAFANMQGGLIIVGVEEDKKTGKPKVWDGIPIEAEQLDRIDSILANMNPMPQVITHLVKNEKENSAFILIKIFAGSNPPYYRRNDPQEWIRTGKISKPIDVASPQYKSFLFSQKDLAEQERYLLTQEVEHIKNGLASIDSIKNTNPKSSLTITILPYLPTRILLKPYELLEKLPYLRVSTGAGLEYPNSSCRFKTTQKGVYSYNHFNTTNQGFLIQLYSQGLVSFSTELYEEGNINGVITERIISYLHNNLQLTKNYYQDAKYSGEIIISIEFETKPGTDMYRFYGDVLGITNTTIKEYYPFIFHTSSRIFTYQNEYEDLLLEIYNDVFVGFGFEPIAKEVMQRKFPNI